MINSDGKKTFLISKIFKMLKVTLFALVLIAFASIQVNGQYTCKDGCETSAQCAAQAGGDMNCRCSYFNCRITEPCGGGCLTDKQCSDWAGTDNCVCTWWFECELEGVLENPGYRPLLKIAEMAKRNKLRAAEKLEPKTIA